VGVADLESDLNNSSVVFCLGIGDILLCINMAEVLVGWDGRLDSDDRHCLLETPHRCIVEPVRVPSRPLRLRAMMGVVEKEPSMIND